MPPRLFYEIAARAFRRHLTYRAAALAGLATNIFFGLLRAAVLLALLNGRPSLEGLSAQGALTYTGLTQALIAFLSLFGSFDIMNTVYRGEVAGDLLRPISYFGFWLAQDAGRALAGLLLRGLTIMLIYAALFRVSVPGSLGQWAALALSLLLAWLLSFAYRFLVNLTAFWSPDARGIGRFAYVALMFGSGFLMPLRLFPDWVRAALTWTPFPSMVNTVVEIYLGLLTGSALVRALLVQATWALALVLLGQWLLGRATRRLVILGG